MSPAGDVFARAVPIPSPGGREFCCSAASFFGAQPERVIFTCNCTHALNTAMSCLSAFVHPLRLTFVEYFKNSGYEGKGEAYTPFSVVEEK